MPKQTSVYEVIYKDPEPANHTRTGGKLFAALNQIVTDNKGAWAQVVECASRSGANSTLNRINSGKALLPAPRENFQFTCRTDSESNKSWLFALYSENGFPEEEGEAKPKRGRPTKAAAAAKKAAAAKAE